MMRREDEAESTSIVAQRAPRAVLIVSCLYTPRRWEFVYCTKILATSEQPRPTRASGRIRDHPPDSQVLNIKHKSGSFHEIEMWLTHCKER